MRRAALVLGLFALFAGAATAQLGRDDAAELSRLKRIKQRNSSEIDQLVDRRFRHDLGLPAEPDPTMRRATPMSTLEKERMLRDLSDEEGTTATYLARYNKMKSEVEALRAEIEAREKISERDDNYVVVPTPGTARRTGFVQSPREAMTGAPGPAGETAPIEPRSLPAGHDAAVQLDRVRGRIQGSTDRLRVAQALFMAGQARMDHAAMVRERGDVEQAKEHDALGKERLQRALVELEPLLAVKEPEYAALFCQGRCLELLFRFSTRHDDLSLSRETRLFQQREQEVREPFLAISARDTQKAGLRGEHDVLGPWGKAAQAAVEHFRWLNLRGNFEPSTPIESLTWPGEKKQQ